MSVLTDLIYGGSHAVAGLTEQAVNDAIAEFGADKAAVFPDTAYFCPTIYAATGVKVKTLGDLPAGIGRLQMGRCPAVVIAGNDLQGVVEAGVGDEECLQVVVTVRAAAEDVEAEVEFDVGAGNHAAKIGIIPPPRK